MKRIFALLLTIALTATFLVGCNTKSSSSEATTAAGTTAATTIGDTSLQKVLDKGEFVLGLDSSFPPMGFTDNKGNIVGFDIDVAKEVAKRMGVTLKLEPIKWDNKIMDLNNKKIDCIWNGFTISDESKEKVLFSIPYMNNNQVLVVLKDSKYNTLDDLKGKTIALQKGSSANTALDGNAAFKKTITPVLLETNLLALNELKNKTAAAVLMDEIAVNYAIAADKANYRIIGQSFAAEEYGIGFRKGEQALCDEVVKQLRAMKADGTLAKISTTWFSKDITTVK